MSGRPRGRAVHMYNYDSCVGSFDDLFFPFCLFPCFLVSFNARGGRCVIHAMVRGMRGARAANCTDRCVAPRNEGSSAFFVPPSYSHVLLIFPCPFPRPQSPAPNPPSRPVASRHALLCHYACDAPWPSIVLRPPPEETSSPTPSSTSSWPRTQPRRERTQHPACEMRNAKRTPNNTRVSQIGRAHV